jgi:MFS family permease
MIDKRILIAVCVAEVLSMASYAGVAAILPDFIRMWSLTNAEAGWISGIYFAGYTLAVPFLVSMTDRVDPRRIYLAAMALSAFSSLGYAFFADGFWTAFAFRALGGIGLAGTYMPGLKMLSDRTSDEKRARVVGIYTAAYSASSSLSFVFVGVIEDLMDWRWAFGLGGASALAALFLILFTVPATPPKPGPKTSPLAVLDFRPVLRNHAALGFMLAYLVVVWVLSANRSWMVAFLEFSGGLQGEGGLVWSAVTCAAIMNLFGLPATILGNEAAIKHGAVRVMVTFFLAATVVGLPLGYLADSSYVAVLVVASVFGVLIGCNASSVTAGTVQVAEPERRGATMALHSCLGFLGGFLGPLAFGYVLDHAGGGHSVGAWGLAFAGSAAMCVVGAALVALLARSGRKA